MSQQVPKPEEVSQAAVEPAEEAERPQQEQMSPEEQEAYQKMMGTLNKMNTKIQQVKSKIQGEQLAQKKNKTDQMTNKLIESKQNSEIITKQNLLTDITETYEQVVIGIYSENAKLKRKVDEMAKLIHQQNAKIYEHRNKEKQLQRENEDLKTELMKLKDQRMVMARGGHTHVQRPQETQLNKKKNVNAKEAQNSQNEDFDFWSMPQNDHGKKKKDFVQDSNLWVNQRDNEAAFVTEEQPANYGRKKR